jgi:hypothetical protein
VRSSITSEQAASNASPFDVLRRRPAFRQRLPHRLADRTPDIVGGMFGVVHHRMRGCEESLGPADQMAVQIEQPGPSIARSNIDGGYK